MIVEDQGEAVAFLQGAAGDLGPTETSIVTHISHIFLKPHHALKLKRAVRFPYVDYSSAEGRLAACRTELELNRRTAPGLYRQVRRITRRGDGRLEFDGDGQLIDAVVEMRRFSEADLFDRMALRDAITPALMTDLARAIAAFHDVAPASKEFGGLAGMADVLEINDRSLRATSLLPAEAAGVFATAFRQRLENHAALLEARREAGKVRRCHGDLILRNICLFEAAPTLFDCIEFSESLATIDILYDLAFLLMDLWHRDRQRLASIVLNRYLDARDETEGLGLVPFFMALRAAVRTHVTAAQAGELTGVAADAALAEARAYFALAISLLKPVGAKLLAFGGLSGSGKSTLAAHAAPSFGAPPGARVLNSDRVRKQLHGAQHEERLPAAAYRPEVSRKVYDVMFSEAARALRVGVSVVVDAVFDRPEDRAAIQGVACNAGVPFHGYWLEAPKDLLLSRIGGRVGDPSDATADVLEAQLRHDAGDIEWTRIDSRRDPAVLAESLVAACGDGPAIKA